MVFVAQEVRKISTIGELFVNLKANTSDFNAGMDSARSSMNDFANTSNRSSTTIRDFANNLNNNLGGSAGEAQRKMNSLNQEVRSAERSFGRNSQQAMQARNAMTDYALSLDDATFKQVYMKNKLGQTEAAFNTQANAIKLNARATKLMGSQTEILTKQMEGLQRHGIKPEMMLPPSTIGQFQMLNETIAAGNKPISVLSLGYRMLGGSVEKTIKGWSAQKMAVKAAQGDMVKYGILMRGIAAGQANLALAFPLVGMAAAMAYGIMFKAALNSDKQLKQLAETVGGKLAKAFDPVIKVAGSFLKVVLTITGKIADLIIKFNEAHPTIAKFAGAILFLLPIMTLLLLPLNLGLGLFNGWKIVLNGLWTTIGPLISTIGLASSTFLTLAAIVAVVVGAFLYLWKTNDGFRNACIKAWDTIKAKAVEVFGGLVNLFNELKNAFKAGGIEGLFNKFGEIFKNLLTNINTLLPQLSKKGSEMLQKIAEGITAGLPVFIQTASTILQTWITTWSNNLPILLNAGLQIIMGLMNGIIAALPMLVNTAVNILLTLVNFITANLPMLINVGMQVLTGLVNGIVANLPILINAAINIINTLVNFIVANLPMLINTGVQIITTLGNAIIANLPKIIDAALRLVQTLANGIIQNIPKIIQAGIKIVAALSKALIAAAPQILSAGLKLIVALAKGVVSGTGQAISAMGKVVSGMLKSISGKIPSFSSIGKSIVSGIARGITGAAGAVVSALGGVVNGAVAAAKKKLKINSPSKVFMAIGGSVGEGLVKGIDKEGTNVKKASSNLAGSTVGGYKANITGIKTNLNTGASIASQAMSKAQEIIVPVYLEGKQIAKATAKYMGAEMDAINNKKKRLGGVL